MRIREDHSDVDMLVLTGPGQGDMILSGDMVFFFWTGLKNTTCCMGIGYIGLVGLGG